MTDHENQVLHVGRTVAQWRLIAEALLATAEKNTSPLVRRTFETLARDLESQLPRRQQADYDYDLQVWVVNGIIQRCGHRSNVSCGCNGLKYAGLTINEARAAAATNVDKALDPTYGQDLAYWRNAVANHVARVTPEQTEEIAAECLRSGAGIWHSCWTIYGKAKGKPCYCAKCNPRGNTVGML